MSAIHHVGYVVEDLPLAVEHAARTIGAGPFFLLEHIAFDEVTYRDERALYDHSSAFGRWGDILLELTQVHAVAPAGLGAALTAPGAGVGHVAWLAESLAEETARLSALGMAPFHTGRSGPVRAVWFDGGPLLGHPVEVLERCEPLLGFYAMVRQAAEGWDGQGPLRRPAPPGLSA